MKNMDRTLLQAACGVEAVLKRADGVLYGTGQQAPPKAISLWRGKRLGRTERRGRWCRQRLRQDDEAADNCKQVAKIKARSASKTVSRKTCQPYRPQ